ncbi:hypothetical protein [Mesorhizobium sp. LNJC405B00]|uniref:hypothetical protein n=1 Tax=Mesorhizobium sp. LNJC405B00 TaxID=1287281 RepID=UPI0003CF36DE|nr:hypothetical protein [Mesorhizobium sp. LNJC405B00]ESX82542.1 hypothetical protein X755_33035 [Mesorhizobium sp. LNJC405B00]
MPTQAQSRLMYFMGQLVHNESIVSKQDIVGLLDHEGSPTADADELLANLHRSLQHARQSLHEAQEIYGVRNAE